MPRPIANLGGIIPGSGAVYNELQAVTRAAFIPKLFVQVHSATPWVSAAMANAQTTAGGINNITIPIQGGDLVTAQSTDYTGAFNPPASQTGIQTAAANLKVIVVPIPFLGMEGLIQDQAAVIPILEARMNDAGNQIAKKLSTDGWTNATYGSNNIDGWPLIAANNNTYAGIDRTAAGNGFWQAGINAQTAGTAVTRQNVLRAIVDATNYNLGETPTCGFMSPATWILLAQNYQGQEQYRLTPSRNMASEGMVGHSGFTALMVADVPIYMDPGVPDGWCLLYNTKYDSFYIHEQAAFAFTGFASTLPNYQLGYVGVLVVAIEHVNAKPRSIMRYTGFDFTTLTALP